MFSLVLSRRDFREYDQIVSVYSKESGKREALAKGIKKITGKNSAALLPFSLLEAEIIPGKEIDHLAKAQPIKVFSDTISRLEKISISAYACKLADEFILPREKDENIFNLLLSFLDFVNSADKINSLNLATGFIFKLWHCFGFGSEEEKFSFWLKSDWEAINNLDSSKPDQAAAYQFACQYAELHSGREVARLANFSEML